MYTASYLLSGPFFLYTIVLRFWKHFVLLCLKVCWDWSNCSYVWHTDGVRRYHKYGLYLNSSLNKFNVVYNLAYCKCVSGLNCELSIVLCPICKIAKVQSLHNQASITTCLFLFSVMCYVFQTNFCWVFDHLVSISSNKTVIWFGFVPKIVWEFVI